MKVNYYSNKIRDLDINGLFCIIDGFFKVKVIFLFLIYDFVLDFVELFSSYFNEKIFKL